MASKDRACGTVRIELRPLSRVRPDPDVERRLREAFPDVWARYEWLLAVRSLPASTRLLPPARRPLPRRDRKPS